MSPERRGRDRSRKLRLFGIGGVVIWCVLFPGDVEEIAPLDRYFVLLAAIKHNDSFDLGRQRVCVAAKRNGAVVARIYDRRRRAASQDQPLLADALGKGLVKFNR